jgi:hypothetical protein
MEDNANFSCRASAMPSTDLASVNGSDVGEGSTVIVVQGKLLTIVDCLNLTKYFTLIEPPPLSVNILQSCSSVFAGGSLNLSCLAIIPLELVISPDLTWSGPGVDKNVTAKSPHSLTLDVVHTRHAGIYTCTATLLIPEAGVNLTAIQTTGVTVQSM